MKIIKEKIERIRYSEKCPICNKEIKGFSESQVKWNLDLHIKQKHNEGLND